MSLSHTYTQTGAHTHVHTHTNSETRTHTHSHTLSFDDGSPIFSVDSPCRETVATSVLISADPTPGPDVNCLGK